MNTSTEETSATKPIGLSSGDRESPPTDPLAHLQQSVRPLLQAGLDQKLTAVFEDKFILHAQAKEILAAMKQTLAKPECERPSCFLIIGAAATGKTCLMNKLFRDLGGDTAKRVGADSRMPLLIVETPARPTEPRLVLALARALRLPIISEHESRRISDIILRKLKERHVRMVVFLEFDHFEPVPQQERSIGLHFIKNITNFGISVVAVGTQKCADLIIEDEQLTSRLRPLYVQGFAKDSSYLEFVATLESFYPFPVPSFLWRDHLDKIYKKTRGIVGETVALLNEAAAWALRNGRVSIDEDALESCAFIEPLTPMRVGKK